MSGEAPPLVGGERAIPELVLHSSQTALHVVPSITSRFSPSGKVSPIPRDNWVQTHYLPPMHDLLTPYLFPCHQTSYGTFAVAPYLKNCEKGLVQHLHSSNIRFIQSLRPLAAESSRKGLVGAWCFH
jgi:hypothetical protein